MDPLSQGLVGAVLAQAFASKKNLRCASVAGFFGGILADVDVLIRSGDDPLLNLEYHRHFTHALLFIPLGGLIAALLLWPFIGRKLGGKRLYGFATLGYATAGLLDACTTYGTRIYWPFSYEKVAWNLISVVDPIFTLVLFFLVGAAFWRRAVGRAYLGLAFGALYLTLGYHQHQRAVQAQAAMAFERKHAMVKATTKPTLGNLFLWRSVYQSEGKYFVDAVNLVPGKTPKWYRGESIEALAWQERFANLDKQTPLHEDLARFEEFSQGYVIAAPDRPNSLGDVRYAMLPNQVDPLWGIEYDPENPNERAVFENWRRAEPDTLQRFFTMLVGEEL
ncbi:MAG: metal-dependent hydrolase [bacterium]|nr:metal-dependent hydrolase [bacterium]